MSVSKAEMAWPSGDQPGDLNFQYPVPSSIAEAIEKSLAASFPQVAKAGVEYSSLTPPTDRPVGSYRLRSHEGQWFVRVSGRSGNPLLESELTSFQAQSGVNVNPFLVAGEPLSWDGNKFRVDVRLFIEGRHFDGSPDDLRTLSASLSDCHRALRAFPGACSIKTATMTRCQRLEEIRERIFSAVKQNAFGIFVENEPWAASHRDWLAGMANEFDPHQLHRHPEAQCLHGEVHPGNVIFRKSDGVAVLIDFEESAHIFAPPSWDLAFMVQRFCLRDSPTQDHLRQRLQAVVDGYRAPLPELAPMMRQIAWFMIATVLDLRASEGILTPVPECDKFVCLERQAATYGGIL